MLRVLTTLLVTAAVCVQALKIEDLVEGKKNAKDVLSRKRRANSGTFEEIKKANYERECVQEQCDREELDEAIPDQAQADQLWDQLRRKCWNEPCDPQGTAKCVNFWNRRECECKAGFLNNDVDGDCTVDVDECAGTDVCQCDHNVCSNHPGGYTCSCLNGFEVDAAISVESCPVCIDIDECERGVLMPGGDSLQQPCSVNQTCINTAGGFFCENVIPAEETTAPVVTTTEEWQTEKPWEPTEEEPSGWGPVTPPPQPPSDRICWPPECPLIGDAETSIWVQGSNVQCENNPCNYSDEHGFQGGCEHGCHAYCNSECECHYQCRCKVGYELTCDYKTCMRI